MSSLGLLLWIVLGIAAQIGVFLTIGFWRHWKAYARLKEGMPETPGETQSAPQPDAMPGWKGFRAFKVRRKATEDPAEQICSFHLEPEDGKPLPGFRPGQFLTFRLEVPATDGSNGADQIVRCYSLSDAPQPDHYRVSIKRVPSPAGSTFPPGRSSNFFHDRVDVGTVLQVRAPSGHFYLESGDAPIVLIAGGIGITPMLSMLNWCVAHQPGREIRFFYGVRNSRDAAFRDQLQAVAAKNPNVHLRLCFSDPSPEDRLGQDFQHRGRVDVTLFRMELPIRPYHFYLCGPTSMMETLVSGLEDWGVPEQRIHFEAFGPASIKHRKTESCLANPAAAASAADITVTFAKSGKRAAWSPQTGSLLELAEAQGIPIDSGCRAGGCGTCQTTIQSGAVAYKQPPDYDPEPGTCLMCVCTLKSDVTLEA
jgi:ferredoxin-NADP reductase